MTYARHNISVLGDGGSSLDFFKGAFQLSNGILGLTILVIVFTVAFSILQARNDTRDSLAGSLFFVTTISFILTSMGMLLPMYSLGCGVLLGFIVLSYAFKK